MTSCIYDFETLGKDVFTAPAVNLALLKFDESRFIDQPYEFMELVESCSLIKFNVAEQIHTYKRRVELETVEWWEKQDPSLKQMLKPSDKDVSISRLHHILVNDIGIQYCNRVYTRGNTFDPILLKSLLRHCKNEDPVDWWLIRDTRSLIDGMTYGHKINNKFIPKGLEDVFIAHDPCHDISMDVMRIQYLARLLNE